MIDTQVMMEQARAALADRPLVVLVLTFASMWACARMGAWLATRRLVDLELEGRSGFGVVMTATLTLLALIIGFTFSMALTRYDERKTRRKWDGENLLAAAVEENRVISAAEKRNHLIEQARLHADVAMLGALTSFRNFQRCKLPRKQFEEKERSRELKRRRAGQSRADRDIAGNFRVKSIHRHA